jgi:hypothetical protein
MSGRSHATVPGESHGRSGEGRPFRTAWVVLAGSVAVTGIVWFCASTRADGDPPGARSSSSVRRAPEPPWASTLQALAPSQPTSGVRPPAGARFSVYEDASSSVNRYKPTGYMGDTGDIRIDEAFEKNPHSGKECIQIVYSAKGRGPNECPYKGPCRWAGVYWQEPPNNWGRTQEWKGRGFDLSGYSRLVFAARADKPARIEFKVGGIDGPYGDSLRYARSKLARLTEQWEEFEIDLTGADLRHIVGGFCWVTNWDTNPQGVTFYLDDIRFERK